MFQVESCVFVNCSFVRKRSCKTLSAVNNSSYTRGCSLVEVWTSLDHKFGQLTRDSRRSVLLAPVNSNQHYLPLYAARAKWCNRTIIEFSNTNGFMSSVFHESLRRLWPTRDFVWTLDPMTLYCSSVVSRHVFKGIKLLITKQVV